VKLAVVSGGGTGIGAACAHRLAAAGFAVLLVGRRRQALEHTADSVRLATAGAFAACEPADLTRPGDVGRVAERVRSEFGGVQVIVSNAGAPAVPHGSDLSEVARAWLQTYSVNTVSAVLLTTALEPMLAAPAGRIILVGSRAAGTGSASPAYTAAKAALEGYMRALAARLGPRGITANVVAPGFTENTELTAGRMPEGRRRQILSSVTLGRPGQPGEIAAAVVFLATPEAGYITGQVLAVDGGYSPWRGEAAELAPQE
jgi:3-oxoacyl-[acyl-carrier protein] reductase